MPDKTRLAKIHSAKKEMRMTDEVYHDILSLHFQVESATQLTDRQVTVLLNRFRAMGWVAQASPKSPKMRTDPFYQGDGKKGQSPFSGGKKGQSPFPGDNKGSAAL